MREWHYKCAPTGLPYNSLSDSSRSAGDAQGIVDHLPRCFGTGRLAYVQRSPVLTAEGGGHALLAFQDPAKRDRPAAAVVYSCTAVCTLLRLRNPANVERCSPKICNTLRTSVRFG